MADRKGTALARRSRPAHKVVSQGNKVNVALPFSMIRAGEPVKMRVGDWISLAGLAITVTGFGVTIRQLIRIADAWKRTRRVTGRTGKRRSRLLAGLRMLEAGLAEKMWPAGSSTSSRYRSAASARFARASSCGRNANLGPPVRGSG
jgi:hypothetical protein